MTEVSSLPAARDNSSPFEDILRELCAGEGQVCSRNHGMEGQTDAVDSLRGPLCKHQVGMLYMLSVVGD